jgi:hypothetical protein
VRSVPVPRWVWLGRGRPCCHLLSRVQLLRVHVPGRLHPP